jgi:hypothetical protein
MKHSVAMSKRARFADAAEQWFRRTNAPKAVTTAELWNGLCVLFPELTTPSERRKTPKATCMRDVRKDPAFEMADGRVTFKG